MFLSQGSNHIALEDGHSQFVWRADGAASCKLSICPNSVERNPESEPVGHQAHDVRSVWSGAVAPVELQMMDATGIARVAAEYMSRNRQRQSPPSRRPETPTERRLLRIWANLLGVEDLDVTETLYSAGGQSLTAIQMLSRIREEFGIELPIMSIFTGDLTIVGLAAAIDQASLEKAEQATLQEEITEINRLTDDEVVSLLESEDV
jgi:acyl carrier protein